MTISFPNRRSSGLFPMYRALGGTGSNRAPCHEVGEVLRGDDVEELAPGRQSAPGEIQQQPARQVQAAVDAEAAIQVRIVDQSLPAHRGARLFEDRKSTRLNSSH